MWSVALKMAGGAFVAVLMTFIAILSPQRRAKARSGWTPTLLAVDFLVAAVAGALIGFCLTLWDLVQDRRAAGYRVPFVLRADFDCGLG
jgi:hypothetical protein